jgi:hypothetical protein
MSVYSYSQTAGSNTTVGGRTVTDAMVPSDVNNAFQGTAGEIAEFRDDIGGKQSTAGSSNTYTLTTNATISSYADGQMVSFVANHSNTGAATLNVDSVGAKAIRKLNDAAVASGDILQNAHYMVQYDASANSAAGAWLLLNPTLPNTHTHALSAITDSGALAALDTVDTAQIDDNAVSLAKQAGGTANRLQGFDGSGDPGEVTIGTGLSLSSGTLSANPVGAIVAWAFFDGNATGTNAPTNGGGVTSITRNSEGDYTINFSSTLASADYGVFISVQGNGINDTNATGVLKSTGPTAAPSDKTTTTLTIKTGETKASNDPQDFANISVMIIL